MAPRHHGERRPTRVVHNRPTHGPSDGTYPRARGGEALVAQVTVDGLVVQPVVSNNLTPPLTAIAAASNRPLWVTDQSGVWSFGGGDQVAWRQVLGGAPDAVPLYPG